MRNAVAALRTRLNIFLDARVNDFLQRRKVLFTQRFFLAQERNVLGNLLQRRRPAQNARHLGLRLQPTKRPLNRRPIGVQRAQLRFLFCRQLAQAAAAQRLHNPNGQAPFLYNRHFALRVLERVIEIVQLQLAKLHVLAIRFQEPTDSLRRSVRRKAQMANAPAFLLFNQVAERAILRVVQILLDVHLAHIVHQVKIEVIHAALAQLLFEDLFRFAHIRQIVAREFACQVERFARILS